MNIYLCSTVRHLLYSLLKGLNETNKPCTIIMITDQQNIEPNDYNLEVIPQHISVVFIKRESIKANFYSGFIGTIIKQLANFKIQSPLFMQSYIKKHLLINELGLPSKDVYSSKLRLFLYNDRNKISRLFRLAFNEYSLIEEGLANYTTFKQNAVKIKLQKIFHYTLPLRYFGDDQRCKEIHLLYPERSPEKLKNKVKNIDFIITGGSMVATAQDVGIFLRALNDGSLLNADEQAIYSAIYEYDCFAGFGVRPLWLGCHTANGEKIPRYADRGGLCGKAQTGPRVVLCEPGVW